MRQSHDPPHPLHRPQESGCRPLLGLEARSHSRRLHLLLTSVLLSISNCWKRSLLQLVRVGGGWRKGYRVCMNGVRRLVWWWGCPLFLFYFWAKVLFVFVVLQYRVLTSTDGLRTGFAILDTITCQPTFGMGPIGVRTSVKLSNSQHSRGLTGGTLKSLAHLNSISSTDRRLARDSPVEVSTPLSAPGRHFPAPPSGTCRSGPVLPVAAPPIAHSATVTSMTTRSSTRYMSLTEQVPGEVVRISHPAWMGGRGIRRCGRRHRPHGAGAGPRSPAHSAEPRCGG
jgi:hypothetical protein